MEKFTTPKDFCHFIMNFEGELTINKNVIYHNGVIVAILNQNKDIIR